MRTTIDLDDELLQRLRDEAQNRGIAVRTLLHRLLQRGLDQGDAEIAETPYKAPAFSLGQVRGGIDLMKALELAATLEDEETVRKIAQRR